MENCETKWWRILVILCIFILGLTFIITKSGKREGFKGDKDFSENNCPTLLVKKEGKIYLYNKNKVEVPGVNPIVFDNLEDYVEFMDWLRAKGIRCPVLYLEEEYDTQNKKQYNVKDDPWSASKETSKKKFYPSNSKKVPVDPSAYDDMDQDIGVKNKIDSRFHSKKKYSPYAMDSNWGGPKYTQKLVNEGEFKGSTREVIG